MVAKRKYDAQLSDDCSASCTTSQRNAELAAEKPEAREQRSTRATPMARAARKASTQQPPLRSSTNATPGRLRQRAHLHSSLLRHHNPLLNSVLTTFLPSFSRWLLYATLRYSTPCHHLTTLCDWTTPWPRWQLYVSAPLPFSVWQHTSIEPSSTTTKFSTHTSCEGGCWNIHPTQQVVPTGQQPGTASQHSSTTNCIEFMPRRNI